ncbi:DUF397 domain-containing protein [Streptomyces albipurpureus]|uniref:DUF397 domain-containing protein n=1 Tax=Streptomyces albipurpureus TaxID=2897419 RepID=A0ABT0UVW0_9ACTN|nr:DUF397 domain-containing protein [Streptomyces sp. CWNU-1]MCM2392566.1 DUF397 domain-containing protein [Streptomyces sp. CWNU-1]
MTTDSQSPQLRWVKSSYSGNGGSCVEWAPGHALATGVVPLRDSKRPTGVALMVSPTAFAGLVTLARSSEV